MYDRIDELLGVVCERHQDDWHLENVRLEHGLIEGKSDLKIVNQHGDEGIWLT